MTVEYSIYEGREHSPMVEKSIAMSVASMSDLVTTAVVIVRVLLVVPLLRPAGERVRGSRTKDYLVFQGNIWVSDVLI